MKQDVHSSRVLIVVIAQNHKVVILCLHHFNAGFQLRVLTRQIITHSSHLIQLFVARKKLPFQHIQSSGEFLLHCVDESVNTAVERGREGRSYLTDEQSCVGRCEQDGGWARGHRG